MKHAKKMASEKHLTSVKNRQLHDILQALSILPSVLNPKDGDKKFSNYAELRVSCQSNVTARILIFCIFLKMCDV